MPQLTKDFGPIAVRVTLDGSGNGTASFQPNGSNARITNLFCKVSTSANQAVVTVYRGTISDTNQLFNSNSGSTGFNARGRIDVRDGDTIFVRWVGGDAGAVATATFTGTTVSFNEVLSGFEIDAEDPIAAGDGSLIYPAIKSPNYVAGVSGWALKRNGDFEAAGAVIRGSVIAANGSIVLDDDGLLVQDSVNMSDVFITAAGGNARIEFQPEPFIGIPPPLGTIDPAVIEALSQELPDGVASLSLSSPRLPNAPDTRVSQINLASPDTAGDTPNIRLRPSSGTTLDIFLDGTSVMVGPDHNDIGRGIVNETDITASTAAISAETVVLTFPSMTYRASRTYRVDIDGGCDTTTANGFADIRLHKTNVAGQTLAEFFRFPIPTVGVVYAAHGRMYFTTGSSAVTASLVLTLQTTVGTCRLRVSTGSPFVSTITDIGPDTVSPNSAVLV